LAKVALGTNGSPLFGTRDIPPAAPIAWLAIGVYVVLCLLALWGAWSRIRAVEVVK
jgi:hypothetical protein